MEYVLFTEIFFDIEQKFFLIKLIFFFWIILTINSTIATNAMIKLFYFLLFMISYLYFLFLISQIQLEISFLLNLIQNSKATSTDVISFVFEVEYFIGIAKIFGILFIVYNFVIMIIDFID